MGTILYREGDWFAVPLQDGGYGVGIVARASRAGVLLGYFFGPARDSPPSLAEVANLRPTDAVLVGMFGHLGLRQKRWPIVGRVATWDRRDWPMPVFRRTEEATDRRIRVFYDEDDPNVVVREEPAGQETDQGPEDGLMGVAFAESRLSRLLHG